MKNHTEKKEAVIATFKAYRTNRIDKYELKAYLEDIEYQLYQYHVFKVYADFEKSSEEVFASEREKLNAKNMWFRFFKGDTLATTINDIINALDCPTNKKHILRNLDAVINDNELEIYFS